MDRSSGCVTLALWMLALPPGGLRLPGGAPPAESLDASLVSIAQELRAEGVSSEQTLPDMGLDAQASTPSMVQRLKWVFAQEGVPEQLVWIAEVESEFDQAATSRSGAAGMFQLMPDTARRFGLEVSATRDERRHPVKSALVAARYLRDLHRLFGSWRLAVAAYHAGEGCVGRAVSGRSGPKKDFSNAELPMRTREYVDLVFNIVEAQEGVAHSRLPPPADRARVR